MGSLSISMGSLFEEYIICINIWNIMARTRLAAWEWQIYHFTYYLNNCVTNVFPPKEIQRERGKHWEYVILQCILMHWRGIIWCLFNLKNSNRPTDSIQSCTLSKVNILGKVGNERIWMLIHVCETWVNKASAPFAPS